MKYFASLLILLVVPYYSLAQQSSIESLSKFIVPVNASTEKVIQDLLNKKIIDDRSKFEKLFFTATGSPLNIEAGAYKLSPYMTEEEVSEILKKKPFMIWIVIPPGLRVEEIANILAKKLNWTSKQKKNFLAYTNQSYNYLEGVYFPDTYLIPLDESPKSAYNRLIYKFNENFSFYQKEFTKQNFSWLKALTLASLVQREAASTEDMPLIAGILLNRIEVKMHLGVDATVQYIRGDKNKNIKNATTTAYWAPISILDKKINSKYNTYKYIGLPPHPICSPSIEAIKAVLNPEDTNCLYYLHDKNGETRCSVTYEEHLQNIQKYLK